MEKEKNLVLDVDESPKKVSEWFAFAIQHILAMLVACITVPKITGLPIAATIISAGLGTLCYLCFTKFKSPVFLSSSFAYLAPMGSALTVGLTGGVVGMNYLAVIIGMAMVGLVYVIVAIVIKFVGTQWINKLLPPIIVGPVIMVIGLSLAGSAVSNLTSSVGSSYNLLALLCGLIAMFATALASHYGKGKFISLIPFIIGMGAGYVSAVLITLIGYYGFHSSYCNIVDFTAFVKIFGKGNFTLASIFNYNLFVPNHEESFIFLHTTEIKAFDWKSLGAIALLFVPVALVTVCEHIGDHENLGNIINKDLLNEEPGMARTLSGDGVATAISGALCGAANTTYGENVAVVGATKIASVKVIMLAAILSILFGFFTPFTAFLTTIPTCVTGGVSLILYGFIASSGVKMLIQEKIDFNKMKNIFIASVILVTGIGGLALKFGNPSSPVIQITSIAVSMILGIILNLVLVEKEEEKVEPKEKAEKPVEAKPAEKAESVNKETQLSKSTKKPAATKTTAKKTASK